jgi:glutathione peroxidase
MNIYESNLSAINMNGEAVKMSSFKGKVLLVVNTASKCGFTPQFDGLEKLYQRFKDQDVLVLGFPCNQFKKQDPGSNEQIASFCKLNYGVSFPMFQKIDVNGDDRHPLYQYLIENAPVKTGNDIKWNFEKFLIDQQGNIVDRFASMKKPKNIETEIEKLV